MSTPPPHHQGVVDSYKTPDDTAPLTKGLQGWTTGKPDWITMILLTGLILGSVVCALLLGT